MTAEDARARLNADVAHVAAGERAALRRVYDATAAKLFGICLRVTGDREAAEDALQDVYLKVWRRARSFDPARASAITWLCLIARGTAIDILRGTARVERDRLALADARDAPPIDIEDRVAIDDCLALLETDSRDAILSAFFDGYSYDELARRSGVPLGTMKSRIRRALMMLRRCLDDA